MKVQEQWALLFLRETQRRLFGESIPRLRKCLGELSEDDVWYRPNVQSNSVGNLVLHLCGNARQWIVSGLGGLPDARRRQDEFDEKGPLPTALLLAKLDELESDVQQVLAELTEEDLIRLRPVQIYEESGIAILVHVIEHFSYHVGQVSYFVKARKNIDLGYYADQNL